MTLSRGVLPHVVGLILKLEGFSCQGTCFFVVNVHAILDEKAHVLFQVDLSVFFNNGLGVLEVGSLILFNFIKASEVLTFPFICIFSQVAPEGLVVAMLMSLRS